MREDWVECKLEDVLVRMTNGSSAKQFNDKVGYPISRIETIWDEKIDLNRVKYVKENNPDFVEKYSIQKNDILLSHINSDNHLGKTAIFKNQTNVLIHGINLLLLRPTKSIVADFLLFQLRLLKINGRFIQVAQRAVNQSSINQRKLKVFELILPPIPIQRAIVTKIENLFTSLDKGIADLKKAQEQLKVYRQAVLKKAFDNLSAETTLEEVKEDSLIGLVRASGLQNNEGIGTEYLKMDKIDMVGNIDLEKLVYVETNEDEIEKYSLKTGDILLNTRNSYELVGKTGVVRNISKTIVFNNNIMRIRVKDDYVPQFVCYQLISPFVRKQMEKFKKATTSVCALYQRNLFPLKLKTTDLEEQHQIVQEIESRLSVCDKIEQSITEGLDKSEALRQSILKKAFEGKLLSDAEIEKCKQEADYEPASVLLERIKKEKKK